MLRQQCKVQGLACKANLFLGQLRLVPKDWAWGQLDVRVIRYKYDYKLYKRIVESKIKYKIYKRMLKYNNKLTTFFICVYAGYKKHYSII
jgi:hypothetical protein